MSRAELTADGSDGHLSPEDEQELKLESVDQRAGGHGSFCVQVPVEAQTAVLGLI